jgi:hypothetical protein
MSLRLIQSVAALNVALADVGGGAALLVDRLLEKGFADLTVVDISAHALDRVHDRLGGKTNTVQLIHSDVLTWRPDRTFKIRHDRAVFHFLTDSGDRDQYVTLAEKGIEIGGYLILATFALDGPTQCSGLNICQYDAAGLADQFSRGFVLTQAETEKHLTPSGGTQSFTWAVLQRVVK